MPIKFTNNASSQLASNFGPADTTITVITGDGDLFPVLSVAGDTFRVTLENASGELEVCECTSRTADQLEVNRNVETVPSYNDDWSIGDRVEIRITGESLNSVIERAATIQRTAETIVLTDTTGSIANAYKGTMDPQLSSYVDNLRVFFKPPAGTTNTGPSTINIDGATDVAIVNQDGSALRVGAIKQGTTIGLMYNGPWGQFVLLDGGTDSADIVGQGTGGGLDADLLDGLQGSSYGRLASDNNYTGVNRFFDTTIFDVVSGTWQRLRLDGTVLWDLYPDTVAGGYQLRNTAGDLKLLIGQNALGLIAAGDGFYVAGNRVVTEATANVSKAAYSSAAEVALGSTTYTTLLSVSITRGHAGNLAVTASFNMVDTPSVTQDATMGYRLLRNDSSVVGAVQTHSKTGNFYSSVSYTWVDTSPQDGTYTLQANKPFGGDNPLVSYPSLVAHELN